MDPQANLPHCPNCKGGEQPGHISLQVRERGSGASEEGGLAAGEGRGGRVVVKLVLVGKSWQ